VKWFNPYDSVKDVLRFRAHFQDLGQKMIEISHRVWHKVPGLGGFWSKDVVYKANKDGTLGDLKKLAQDLHSKCPGIKLW